MAFTTEAPFTALAPPSTHAASPAPRRGRFPNDSLFLCFSNAYGAVTGLTASCSHRNRLRTWSNADSGKTATAEPNTEYEFLVYDELGMLVHKEPGLTGTVWAYPETDEIAESGLGQLSSHMRVKIRTWGASRMHEAIR